MPMKKNSTYWAERVAQDRFDLSKKQMGKQIKKLYRDTNKAISGKVTDLYLDMLETGEITTTELYAYGRYKGLSQEINKELKALGTKEIKIINQSLEQTFKDTFKKTSLGLTKKPVNWGLVNQKAMEQVLLEKWSGKHFSTRIWANKKDLSSRLRKGITDSVSLGYSKDKLVGEIRTGMGVGFNEADRLVRTELMNVINQGQKYTYAERGYTKYTLLPYYDNRTSDICNDLDTSIEYEFLDAVTGDTYPPLHPNCRTTVKPVISSREDGAHEI